MSNLYVKNQEENDNKQLQSYILLQLHTKMGKGIYIFIQYQNSCPLCKVFFTRLLKPPKIPYESEKRQTKTMNKVSKRTEK